MGTLDTKVLAMITKSRCMESRRVVVDRCLYLCLVGWSCEKICMHQRIHQLIVCWEKAAGIVQGQVKMILISIFSHVCLPAMRHDAGANSGGAGLAATVRGSHAQHQH